MKQQPENTKWFILELLNFATPAPRPPSGVMLTESGNLMLTEGGDMMDTED